MNRHNQYLILAIMAFLLVSACRSFWIQRMLKPKIEFQESKPPKEPDYSQAKHWAAHPDRQDNADVVPVGETKNNQDKAPVDVFFIHPTTYVSKDHWNQPMTDKKTNRRTDNGVLRNQASVFNSCCKIYAPRYRQATLYSFLDAKNGDKALALAYHDVKKAFAYYLKHWNQGRPFLLAGHSQGAWHGLHLLEEKIVATPIQKQMVAAYLVGMPLPEDKFQRTLQSIELCQNASQTGCLITWNSMAKDADVDRLYAARVLYPKGYESNKNKTIACVNPLNWQTNSEYADYSLNLGGVQYLSKKSVKPYSPDTGISDAVCKKGILWVNPKKNKRYQYFPLGKNDYHLYDYSLFHMNIRNNAVLRAKTFLQK